MRRRMAIIKVMIKIMCLVMSTSEEVGRGVMLVGHALSKRLCGFVVRRPPRDQQTRD